ncbi:HAD hydrolase-like protein [Rhodococcus sp. HNM0569]|uniref:HAD hydrolase-like protein n=1 Tax=Rhodococcus sp. HNM0569 TaxID=2716340 RepID=UPI003211F501
MTSPSTRPVLLFDLDGTITDSAPGIHAGFRHALAAVGHAGPTAEQLATVVGPPMLDTLRGLPLDDDTAHAALDAYLAYYDSTGWAENSVFPGMAELLDKVDAAGFRAAVATSKSERFAHRILDHFALAERFEFIGGSSEDGTRRAKSDVVAHSLRALGVEVAPEATRGALMIGDRHHDVDGAARWGIPTVLVEWGYGRPEEADGAYRAVASPAELWEVLDDYRC